MISLFCGDRAVGGSIRVAATFASRFAGLMFRRGLPEGAGLLLMPCAGVHMCFMRMPLDVVYMDGAFRVLGVQRGLRPWRLGRSFRGTHQVLELPAGTAGKCGISPGCQLRVGPPAAAAPCRQEGKREFHGYRTA